MVAARRRKLLYAGAAAALIENMFAKNEGEPRTLIMDVTLNHLSDDEITETLQEAKPYIDDGRLNLILLRSGTKFMQNGMDLTGIGVGTVINNRRDEWAEFNEKMEQHRQDVAQDDVRYIANMLDANRVELKQYLDKVRDNTSTLRAMLEKKLGGEGGGAIELGRNTDPKTVYLAIKPSDAYVAQVKNKAKEDVTPQDRVDVNQEMYRNDLLPAFENLAAVDRSSFGFNSTNFGETGETIRITLGVEENAMLKRYAQIIAEVSRSIPSRERQA
ncbi:MAG: hypothetical protein QOI13_3096 [Paraburkholderia sp.]|nr:hypothetical protein [Paraburkholderia sp.]